MGGHMGILDRISASLQRTDKRSSIDTWITDYLLPANQFVYNGYTYGFGQPQMIGNPGQLIQTYGSGQRAKEISATLPAYSAILKQSPPAFAAELVRALVLSQARFTFRNRRSTKTPRRTFGTSELAILETPWPRGTTGELIARMEWHAGLAGNAYVVRQGDRLRVLRPDWVAILYGSDLEPDDPALALDSEIIGYLYCNGGFAKGGTIRSITPSDIAHWTPVPDPEAAGIGMSWVTPAIRELQADQAATEHKLKYFLNGATPNLVIKGLPAVDKVQFDQLVDMIEERHTGLANAYRTLYLTAGADATIVGSNLEQITFSDVQGAGETRITALSRVPAIMIGLSEGLKGAALNAGNFGQVRRMFADTWIYPTLQDLTGSLAPLVNVPSDAELWFDVLDMPVLREDAVDAASITAQHAQTIGGLVRDGFTPESAKAATIAGDMTLLVPIEGWLSVQLQPGGPGAPALPAPAPAPVPMPPSGSKNNRK
jgi:phage portal protein BeeE